MKREPLFPPMSLCEALDILVRVHTQYGKLGMTVRMGATPDHWQDMERYPAAWAAVRRAVGLPVEPDEDPRGG